MDRIEQFRIFVRVVDCAGFTRAADQLDLPRSTVSEAVRALEHWLGTRLLHRTTRRVTPTQDGLLFHARCQQLIADMDEAGQLFRQSPHTLSGRLRVDVPGRIGRLIVAPALPGFLAAHPGIDIELGMTDRTVDLVEDGVDCALRVGPLPDSRRAARGIGQLRLINVAGAGYLATHGLPTDPRQLHAHWSVGYAAPGSGRTEPWEWREEGGLRRQMLRTRVCVDNAEAYIACCIAGLGLIQVPAYDVRRELADGRLVEVMPGHRADPMPMHLLYPHHRHPSRPLRVFVDWLQALLDTAIR
ncbi:LysR family transcriptional regulator [Stenotrophomonas mori]|uniref:LysR family transcriptional regulator n=1 Tax=Stenotrophomonas mori TaxID=2871096 RepID=A0ABT0SKB1_9GAMM|nr:LysR family transcriptional regulator [Stenotrophomonas mori]MCL7715756.1 LysR family transcriptional regulator [Stenotrophomonas mori]